MGNGDRCEICGAQAMSRMYDLGDREIIRCGNCGTARTVFMRLEAFSQGRFDAERWLEGRGLSSSILFDDAKQRYKRLERFSPGKKLLEIGCGTGEFLETAGRHGHDVVGLDLSVSAVEYVKKKLPGITVLNCLLREASIPPRSFDVVVGFHVLEHVENPRDLLGEIREILKPGGLICLAIPNVDSYYRRVLGKNWWGFVPEHAWHFSREGLHRALEQAQFQVLEQYSMEEKYPVWPIIPLYFGHRTLLRKLGNLFAPRSTSDDAGQLGTSPAAFSVRLFVKKVLFLTRTHYCRAGSVMLAPFLNFQTRRGGGDQLFAVARRLP